MPIDDKSIHHGHRQRVKKKFKENGIDGFADHEVLEMLLFYAKDRCDVNPLAHKLINEFGSLASVFDAPYEQLVAVDDVGDNTAILIKLVPQICRRYLESRNASIAVTNTETLGAYIMPSFYGRRQEAIYVVCMDAKGKVIGSKKIADGDNVSAVLDIANVVKIAMVMKAAEVAIAHNHPSGVAVPSNQDIVATRRLISTLAAVGVGFLDHIIVADDEFVSLRQSKLI